MDDRAEVIKGLERKARFYDALVRQHTITHEGRLELLEIDNKAIRMLKDSERKGRP